MAQHFIKGFLLISATILLCKVGATITPTDNDNEVCYGALGCFSALPPFAPNMPLPMPPTKIGTKFILHTRPNTTVEQVITASADVIQRTSFQPTKKTKIVIHGFAPMYDGIAKWVSRMTQAILQYDDVNVIIVDWVGGAGVAYDQAVTNTRLVGAQIAQIIRTLMELHGYDPRDIHLIGFSLGAHVAGFAGKDLLKFNKNHKLGRITGLDPANPGFNYDSAEVRLDKGDAHFVDVIHTDTKTLLVVASGMNRNIGHADYYPNGGESQPGCATWSSDSSLVSAVTDMTVCDHVRAPTLYMNSINTTKECNFAAYRCGSYGKFKEGRCVRCSSKGGKKSGGERVRCNEMGYWARAPATKKQVQYYLETSASEPFCAKHYQVQLHWRRGPGSSKIGFRASLYVTLHGEKGDTEEYALNDGVTFTVVPGKTSRFLVSHDCRKDIGRIDRVTFRWERPTCWTYFFCPNENVYLKRVKIIDALEQKRLMFLPLEMDLNNDGRKDVIEVPVGQKQDLFRKSYISSRYPGRLSGRTKTPRQPAVVPELTDAVESPKKKSKNLMPHGRLIHRISKHKRTPAVKNPSERLAKKNSASEEAPST